MKTVLIVEDDTTINNFITDFFEIKNYKVMQAFSGTEALLLFNQAYDKINCIILDLMLPGIDGEKIIEKVKEKQEIPIIVVSAKDKEESKLIALKLGADDFLLKPFSLEELFIKVEKIIKLYSHYNQHKDDSLQNLVYKNINLSFVNREVVIDNRKLVLTTKEFDILSLFLNNPNKVFTKDQLFKEIWQEEYCFDTKTVSVHVSNLRKKLSAYDDNTPTIETVWGIGYKLQ